MTLAELRASLKAKHTAMEELRSKASLTEDEQIAKKALMTELRDISAKITEAEEAEKRDKADGDFLDSLNQSLNHPGDSGHFTPATAPDQPIYRGSPDHQLGAQLADIRLTCSPSHIADPRAVLEARSRLQQSETRDRVAFNLDHRALAKEGRAAGTGGFTLDSGAAGGGFFLSGTTTSELITHGFNNGEVIRRCDQRVMTGDQAYIDVIGLNETSRATGSRGGGVRVYTDRELGSVDPSKTDFVKRRWEAYKLTGFYNASSEVLRSLPFLGGEMRNLFGKEYAFKWQDIILRGSGTGEGLGLLNSPAKVAVSAVADQDGGTVVTENILQMESQIYHDSSNLVYFINRELKKQLSMLTINIGTSGVLAPLYEQKYDQGVTVQTLMGRPCVTIEQCEAPGTEGDIILADMSEYMVVTRGGIDEAMSMHVYFLYDQSLFRFIHFFGGAPKWETAITPYKGSQTTSPIITLATRS